MTASAPIRTAVTVVDELDLNHFLREIPGMSAKSKGDTLDLLEELQKAADEHQKILERQSELIRRLREELKDVRG